MLFQADGRRRACWGNRWRAEGGGAELLRLAIPLILSTSFWTIQITIDRILLARYSTEAVAASIPAALLFWTPLILLQSTAAYVTTFVAQYTGAGRPHRVGPAVWQGMYFAVLGGLAFLAFIPLAGPLVALGGHDPTVQQLEVVYFECLAFAALPFLLTAAASSFFAGRGYSWTVMWINGVGTLANAVLDYAWIFGRWGLPEWGIAGAGWATVVGSWVSAVLAVLLLLRREYREEFCTLSGWRLERELFGRLMRYGLPSGAQMMLDALAFTVFIFVVGRLGPGELAATNIAFTINMFAFMPAFGMGQAVAILVGQRLGQDRPEVAERTTWVGLRLTCSYVLLLAVFYFTTPGLFLWLFQNEADATQWALVAAVVPVLLRFVAVYSLFDGINILLAQALKGAGDTLFVSAVSLGLAWPLMVLPTWLAWKYGWGLYWCWAAASAYIIVLAFTFLLRFRHGRWKTMRVIETAPVEKPQAISLSVNGPGGLPTPGENPEPSRKGAAKEE